MLSHMRFPVFSFRMRMMRQIRRPTALDDILRSLAIHYDLIRKSACFSHNEHVKWVVEIVVIYNRVVQGIIRLEGNGTA